jgi:serine/threonine protein kinase
MKRWRFVRKIMKCCLESLGFIHKNGFCHNALSEETIWLSTMDQQEIDSLHVKIADLGMSTSFEDLGPYARGNLYISYLSLL